MLEQDGEGWERLFAEPNFVVAHGKYLSIEIYVRGLEPHRHARVQERLEIIEHAACLCVEPKAFQSAFRRVES